MANPKPSTLPRWASTVTADSTRFVEPTSGKKDVGWATQERPAAQHINWLFEIIYTWCLYLDTLIADIAAQNWVWTGTHSFSNTAAFPGHVTGNTTFDNNVIVTGTVTAPEYKQTSFLAYDMAAFSGAPWGPSLDWDRATASGYVESIGMTTPTSFIVPLTNIAGGDTINVTVSVEQSVATAGAIECKLRHQNFVTNTITTIATVGSGAVSGVPDIFTIATNHVVTANAYFVEFNGDGITNCDRRIYGVGVARKRV